MGGKFVRKVCIIGCFADTLDLLNGQTVKTKIVYKELEKSLLEAGFKEK